MSEHQKAKDTIKAIIDDKQIEVGGRKYDILPTTHERRLKISAFMSSIRNDLLDMNMSFTLSKEFKEVKNIIDEMTLFENGLLSKEQTHWEYFPIQEYYNFYITMMSVAVELLPERPTN